MSPRAAYLVIIMAPARRVRPDLRSTDRLAGAGLHRREAFQLSPRLRIPSQAKAHG